MTEADQVERVAQVVRDVFGNSLVGAYLCGSYVAGSLKPASDIDLLVITDKAMDRAQRERLYRAISPLSGPWRQRPPGWRPLEITVVVESEIKPWHYPSRVDLQYGEWRRAAFEAGDFEPEERAHADLTVLLAMARQASRALIGPPADQVLDDIPRADLVSAMVDDIGPLVGDLDEDTANVLLTLARIWATLETGSFSAKDAAAAWAAERLPTADRPPLDRARKVYLGEVEDVWTGLEGSARKAAAVLVGKIERPR